MTAPNLVVQPKLTPFISRAEWRRVIAFSTVVIIIIGLPYLIGVLASTPDRIFSGFLVGTIGIEDLSSYVAKMMQGAHGAWLMQLPYTAQPHTPTIFYLVYLLLGKVCALLGVPMVVGYHAARLIFSFGMLLVIYRFIAEFVAWPAVRWVAFIFVALAGGTGWISILSGQPGLLDTSPLELMSPESYTFWMMYTTTHLLLARSLLLLGAINVRRAGRSRSVRTTLIAGVLWLAMALVQPIYTVVAGAIGLMMVASRSLEARRIDWYQARAVLIAAALASPMVLYSALVFAIDPVYGRWTATQVTTSAGPLIYLASYAVPLLLACLGLPVMVRRRTAGSLFLAIWLISLPLLIYAPTITQRRLIEGGQIALSVVAAYGLIMVVLPWLHGVRRFQRHLITLLTATLALTYVLLLVWHTLALLGRQSPFFYDRPVIEAGRWLEQHAAPSDGVMAAYTTGTVLPTLAPVRVLAGHHTETAWGGDRKADIQKFFQSDTPDVWRRNLLATFNVKYVMVGPAERQLGDFDPARAAYLKEAFATDDIRIYRVEP